MDTSDGGRAQAAPAREHQVAADAEGQTSRQPAAPPLDLVVLLVLVTAVQVIATFTVLALPTLATRAAPTFGVGAETVGYQISVIYVAAAVVSSFAGLVVRRYGPAATSMMALGLCTLALLAIATGTIAMAVLGSLLVGAGYGLTNPAASHLLLRFGPRQHQNLVFALKQTGVPLGGMLAAMMLPALALSIGWQGAMAASVGLIGLLVVPLALRRGALDDDRTPNARFSGGMLRGVTVVLRNPSLRALAIMGLTYASFQFCLFAFLITMLVEQFGWTLVAAGGMATAMQIGGAIGRIAWSVLADRVGHGLWVLVANGIGSTVMALALAAATPQWPVALLTLVLVAFGFCLVGWNGLWMAEIARTSGPAEVGLATGGVLVFTYMGVMSGPAAFALGYRILGSYTADYGLFAGLTIVGAAALLLDIRRRARGGSSRAAHAE